MDPVTLYWLKIGGMALAAAWWLWPKLQGRFATRETASGFLGEIVRPVARPTPKVPSAEDTDAAVEVIRRRLVGKGYDEGEAIIALAPLKNLLEKAIQTTPIRSVSAR